MIKSIICFILHRRHRVARFKQYNFGTFLTFPNITYWFVCNKCGRHKFVEKIYLDNRKVESIKYWDKVMK